jgi:hypothetical protein
MIRQPLLVASGRFSPADLRLVSISVVWMWTFFGSRPLSPRGGGGARGRHFLPKSSSLVPSRHALATLAARFRRCSGSAAMSQKVAQVPLDFRAERSMYGGVQ